MASLFAASSSFRIVSAARHECLAITQLPKIHLRLPPINSRASCFWSRSRFPQAPFSAIRQSRGSIGPRSQAVPFSTSLILRQQQNDGNPRPSEPVRETVGLTSITPSHICSSLFYLPVLSLSFFNMFYRNIEHYCLSQKPLRCISPYVLVWFQFSL